MGNRREFDSERAARADLGQSTYFASLDNPPLSLQQDQRDIDNPPLPIKITGGGSARFRQFKKSSFFRNKSLMRPVMSPLGRPGHIHDAHDSDKFSSSQAVFSQAGKARTVELNCSISSFLIRVSWGSGNSRTELNSRTLIPDHSEWGRQEQ